MAGRMATRALSARMPSATHEILVEIFADLKAERSGYTRAQFAFDLARLKSERRLVVDAQRVDLGVATGLATQKKRSVFWIEDERGAGQYFATFRLLPHTVEDV